MYSVNSPVLSKNLYCKPEGTWLEIPQWAQALFQLGRVANDSVRADARLVIGVAVPTRSFAAALIGCGIIVSRAAHTTTASSPIDHFKSICQLPAGTAVSIQVGQRKKTGIFVGTTDHKGESCATIMVNSKAAGGGSHLIRVHDAWKVHVLGEQPVNLPKRQTGKLVRPPSAFADIFIDRRRSMLDSKTARLNCLIIGRINRLSREILTSPFASADERQELHSGTLQDILLARRFLNEGEPYRSEIVRVNGRSLTLGEDDRIPHFVIFDGSTAFIRWHSRLRQSNWVVVLDRTDTRLRVAAEILNEAHLNRLNENPIDVPMTVDAIEVMSFHARA